MRRIVVVLSLLGLAAVGLGYAVGLMTRPGEIVTPGVAREDIAYQDSAVTAQGTPVVLSGNVPGWQNVYVNDYGDLLSPEAEAKITSDLIELYDFTGVEMTVLTIPSRGQYGFEGTNEAFATRLFNTWGIGNASSNDGVLILVSQYDREMRIELGAGYGRARDADMQEVIDAHFLPFFRQDLYERGIVAGTAETIRAIAGVYPGEFDQSTLQRGWSGIARALGALGAWAYGLLVIPLVGLAWMLRQWQRYRPRPCPTCATTMVLQAEDVDDAHLSGGQRLEEFVRSVDYDVYECPKCSTMEISRYPSWFSSYGTCPSCEYRTLRSTTEVLKAATTSSTGRKRIDYSCQNCDYTDSEERTIPKISKSSSSGSSRSSFGGGSSSGGGASGSW